jgi:hypothetical protein
MLMDWVFARGGIMSEALKVGKQRDWVFARGGIMSEALKVGKQSLHLLLSVK